MCVVHKFFDKIGAAITVAAASNRAITNKVICFAFSLRTSWRPVPAHLQLLFYPVTSLPCRLAKAHPVSEAAFNQG